jgi:phage shock protein A
LFHGINWNFAAGASLTFFQLKESLSSFEREETKIASIVAERTGMSEAEIRELFRQGESKDLQFAIDKGIISEVRDPAVPKDAPLITVNLN